MMVAAHAQALVYRLVQLMPSAYMRSRLGCLLALFLASSRPRPQQSQTKSAAALSRFLNRYGWPTGKAIRTTRQCLNGKRGVHVALLYLTIGPFRFPWSFRVYRGKGTATPTQLALKLLAQIPGVSRG